MCYELQATGVPLGLGTVGGGLGTDEFLLLVRLLDIHDIDLAGRRIPNAELIRQLMTDPERLATERARWEYFLRNDGRVVTEELLRALHATAAYLSDLIGGPVPVLLPRNDVNLLSAADGDAETAAVAAGRSLQRLVQAQAAAARQPRDEHLLASIEEMITRIGPVVAATPGRYLTTEQIAMQLGLAPKTVRKLFQRKQLLGKKLASGEWRTTQEELERSPYLQGRGRRRRATLE